MVAMGLIQLRRDPRDAPAPALMRLAWGWPHQGGVWPFHHASAGGLHPQARWRLPFPFPSANDSVNQHVGRVHWSGATL